MLFGNEIVGRLQLDEFSRIGSFQLLDSGDPLRDPIHHFAHRFTVMMPATVARTPLERDTLDRIVEMAKPAHSSGRIELIEPALRIGCGAFLGLNTVVGRYPSQLLEGVTKLSRYSVLGPSAAERGSPALRIGTTSRIGSTTLID